MKFQQIMECKLALEALSSEYNLPIAYELAKNLKRTVKVLNDATDIAKDIGRKFAETEGENFKRDKDGMLIFKSPEDKVAYDAEIAKLNHDDLEIEFHKIPIRKIKKYIEEHGIKGVYLAPLIDVVFIDEGEKEG